MDTPLLSAPLTIALASGCSLSFSTAAASARISDSEFPASALPGAANPWQLCEALAGQYQYNCARYQSGLLVRIFGQNLPDTAAACQRASREILRSTCLDSLGYRVAQSAEGEATEIIAACRRITFAEGRQACFSGAAREVRFQHYENSTETSQQLCALLPAPSDAACLHAAGGVVE